MKTLESGGVVDESLKSSESEGQAERTDIRLVS